MRQGPASGVNKAPPQFEICAAAYDADGKLLKSIDNFATQADAGSATKAYRMQQQLEVPEASKFLRAGIRDINTGKVGAIEIPLPLSSSN